MQIKKSEQIQNKQKDRKMKAKQNENKAKSPKKMNTESKSPVKDSKSPKKTNSKPFQSKNRVIIKNLDTGATKEDIEKTFNSFGKILNILLPTTEAGKKNKGIAFVSFKAKETMEEVLKKTKKGIEICGMTSSVDKADPKNTTGKNKKTNIPTEKKTKAKNEKKKAKKEKKVKRVEPFEIKVSGLPDVITKELLNKHFANFGEVTRVSIPGKKSKNIAFVGFTSQECVDKALQDKKQKIEGNAVIVDVAKSAAHTMQSLKNGVVLYGLPKSAEDSDVKSTFTEGNIVAIHRFPNMGLSVAEFDTDESAKAAAAMKMVEIAAKKIRVKALRVGKENNAVENSTKDTPAKNKKKSPAKNKKAAEEEKAAEDEDMEEEESVEEEEESVEEEEESVEEEIASPGKRAAADDSDDDMEVSIPSSKKKKVQNGSAVAVTPKAKKSPKAKNTPKNTSRNKNIVDTPRPKPQTPKSEKKNKENQVTPQSQKKQNDKKRRQSMGLVAAADTPADKKKRRQSLGVMKSVNTPKKSK